MDGFLIGGNWKMHKGPEETRQMLSNLKKQVDEVPEDIEILVCPPSISLTTAMHMVDGSSIKVGAQNVFFKDNGSYTGEISTRMLNEIGCSHVIVGHSERRQHFGETNRTVNKKTKKVLSAGLQPIICVGESLEQRKDGMHKMTVEKQLEAALNGIEKSDIKNIIVAYEPLWAIGTGESADPEKAQEMHAVIRKEIAELYTPDTADGIPIVYGGSMKPDNAEALLAQDDINGGLIGGASLEAQSFAKIFKIAKQLS